MGLQIRPDVRKKNAEQKQARQEGENVGIKKNAQNIEWLIFWVSALIRTKFSKKGGTRGGFYRSVVRRILAGGENTFW